MKTINEVQLALQILLNRTVSQAEIGKALGTGRANISLRVKNKSGITEIEKKKLENYFNVHLAFSPDEILSFEPHKDHSDNYYYIKSIQILDCADDKELEFYYGVLEQCRQSIHLVKA